MFERKAIGKEDVVAAFHGSGISLRSFPVAGRPPQYTATVGTLNPAVVVEVFPNETAARRAEQTIAINGRRVRAIGVRNVRIWVASGAPGELQRHVSHAIASLKRVR